ncbi:uncharacterized protein LOC125572413 [Nematostella vectensis]|uniref:uncharacterized protein LOC125572413 n=1 Tax=Nematostella vectensis TaxID=45351 RepID=UPI002076E9AE|nr:uncharacterized protein LOC125572413 [Nematostella vectensis]
MELEERFRRPHRYAVSKDETKENQHEKTRSNIFLIILMGAAHGLVLKVEKALNRLGAAVYKKGRLAFGTTFVIMTLLCLGYMRSQKTDWAPQGFQCHTNQARNDLGDAAKIFPNLDAWKSEVIFTNGVSENVLDSDCLIAASSFVRTIDKTSVAFKRNCALCQLPTLSDFYQLNNESLLRIDDCQRTCTLEKLLVSDTVTLSKVRVHKVNYNQSNLSANGIIVTFHLKRPIDYREKTLFHTFEKDLTLTLRQLSSRYTCRMVLRLDKNEEDKVWLTVTPSRQLLLYALPAILFVCLELIFYVFTRSVFLMIAIFVVSTNTVFCASVAFGFLSILSIPYHDFYLIVPLYGYCQCLVLCLPLVNSINATSSWNSINRQVKECMTKAGFVVTVTALVVIVLNGIAAWSCIIAITRFMVFLFLLILLNFVSLFLTVFPILVWLSEYLRSGAKRNRGLSCSRGFRQGLRKWTKALSSLTGKIIVLGFILSIVGGCITYICVVRPPAFNDRRLTDLYDKHVKEASSSQVVSLIVRNVDYTNNELRKSLADFVKMLSSASYSAGKPRSWISSFELWRKSENRNCTGSEFKVCLQIFFNTSKASFEYDIKIENGRLTESRIQLPV